MAVTPSWRSRLAPFLSLFSLGVAFMFAPAYSSIACFRRPLRGAYCLGPVAAWAAESSDTAWIRSLIIRQMGWSRCGLCGDSGAVWGVGQGPTASPLLPRPTVRSTEGAGCSWGNRTPSFQSLLPLPPLFLSFSAALSYPYWGEGGASFVPKHTYTHTQHLKDTSWIWQRLWNEGEVK